MGQSLGAYPAHWTRYGSWESSGVLNNENLTTLTKQNWNLMEVKRIWEYYVHFIFFLNVSKFRLQKYNFAKLLRCHWLVLVIYIWSFSDQVLYKFFYAIHTNSWTIKVHVTLLQDVMERMAYSIQFKDQKTTTTSVFTSASNFSCLCLASKSFKQCLWLHTRISELSKRNFPVQTKQLCVELHI